MNFKQYPFINFGNEVCERTDNLTFLRSFYSLCAHTA